MKFIKHFACTFTIIALCSSSITALSAEEKTSIASRIAQILPMIDYFSAYFAKEANNYEKYSEQFEKIRQILDGAIVKVQKGESGLISAIISLEKVALSMVKIILKEHKGKVSSGVVAGGLLAFFADKYGNEGKGLDRLKGKFSKTKGVLLESCYLCKLKTCVVCKVQELYAKLASFFGAEKDNAAQA